MEFFLPSLVLMLSAFLISVYVIPNFTPVVIVIGAILCLVLAVYNHYSTFSGEYNVMQWAESGKQIAPTLITGLIIVLLGGYVIYLYGMGGKMGSLPSPPSWIPHPDTATNPVTHAIGTSLVAAWATNINRNYNRNSNAFNTAHRNQAESILARAP